jgi:hypothetical protein
MGDEILHVIRQIAVLNDVVAERNAQDRKWGVSNHPDINPRILDGRVQWAVGPAQRVAAHYEIRQAEMARAFRDSEHRTGQGSFAAILLQEISEAIEAAAQGSPNQLRHELVQAAAVTIAWIEKLDRELADARDASELLGGHHG